MNDRRTVRLQKTRQFVCNTYHVDAHSLVRIEVRAIHSVFDSYLLIKLINQFLRPVSYFFFWSVYCFFIRIMVSDCPFDIFLSVYLVSLRMYCTNVLGTTQ